MTVSPEIKSQCSILEKKKPWAWLCYFWAVPWRATQCEVALWMMHTRKDCSDLVFNVPNLEGRCNFGGVSKRNYMPCPVWCRSEITNYFCNCLDMDATLPLSLASTFLPSNNRQYSRVKEGIFKRMEYPRLSRYSIY